VRMTTIQRTNSCLGDGIMLMDRRSWFVRKTTQEWIMDEFKTRLEFRDADLGTGSLAECGISDAKFALVDPTENCRF
jgi:hypothetical protein